MTTTAIPLTTRLARGGREIFAALHFCAAAVALTAVWKAEVCNDENTPTTLFRGGAGVFVPDTTEQQSRGFAVAGILALAVPTWMPESKAVILVLLGGWVALHTAATDLLRCACPGTGTGIQLGAGAFAAYLAAAAGGWSFALDSTNA